MIKRLTAVAASFMASLIFLLPAAEAKDKLIMGVHPYKPPVELQKIFKPVADYISKETGKEVEIRIGQTYEDATPKSDRFIRFRSSVRQYMLRPKEAWVAPLARS
jgi:ABC-type phosphate/phosphonate transport system substrate-binding protein